MRSKYVRCKCGAYYTLTFLIGGIYPSSSYCPECGLRGDYAAEEVKEETGDEQGNTDGSCRRESKKDSKDRV